MTEDRKASKTALGAAALATALSASAAHAASGGSMRCSGELIGPNDYEAEVVAKCGEPDQRDGSRLFYVKGHMVYIVHILGGKVSQITEERK